MSTSQYFLFIKVFFFSSLFFIYFLAIYYDLSRLGSTDNTLLPVCDLNITQTGLIQHNLM